MEAEKRVNLVLLDACRDNPFTRSLRASLGTRSAAVGQGLAPIAVSPPNALAGRASGTLVAFATQPDNVALDGEGRNSPFTAALLKHLPTPGLEVEQLMRRVRTDVASTTKVAPCSRCAGPNTSPRKLCATITWSRTVMLNNGVPPSRVAYW